MASKVLIIAAFVTVATAQKYSAKAPSHQSQSAPSYDGGSGGAHSSQIIQFFGFKPESGGSQSGDNSDDSSSYNDQSNAAPSYNGQSNVAPSYTAQQPADSALAYGAQVSSDPSYSGQYESAPTYKSRPASAYKGQSGAYKSQSGPSLVPSYKTYPSRTTSQGSQYGFAPVYKGKSSSVASYDEQYGFAPSYKGQSGSSRGPSYGSASSSGAASPGHTADAGPDLSGASYSSLSFKIGTSQ